MDKREQMAKELCRLDSRYLASCGMNCKHCVGFLEPLEVLSALDVIEWCMEVKKNENNKK